MVEAVLNRSRRAPDERAPPFAGWGVQRNRSRVNRMDEMMSKDNQTVIRGRGSSGGRPQW